ncbi:extracellular solute-binding protein [Salipaludibacillus sp. LMS25]|jgi:raffinose/stachyose/melibiose transport system substrate-binding protein|uniref:ABC transporter substrate-binding protein n=1 Tax=Salipaludibacillus sp. LMS25 TaxID=2924031 RepID=UPI0020D08740|nr:extracellular solute-binding protein [Salipaludibacillus sp. LMS25]UTR13743.1 extracellular solute-binding protein [Salipaludibacillus sp. LMS25]
MKKQLMAGCLATLGLLTACGGNESSGDDSVELEFFQFKGEAINEFDALIDKFEEENPTIRIKQNNVPDSDTVLLSRMTQNDIPDIMTINGGVMYGEVATSGVLRDVTEDENTDRIIDEYEDMLKRLSGTDELYAFPHTVNANGVIYNKGKFNELGLEVPETWDEFIALADEIEAQGETPFYSGYGESWTILPPLNSLASNIHGMGFFDRLEEGESSFTDEYKEVAEKLETLLTYTDNDVFGHDYNIANNAFANGESVMYMQGVWAIAEILDANPDMEIGVFPMPATNNAGENDIVSGVDVAIAIAEDTDYPDEAKRFVDFLLEPENVELYLETQRMFSAVEGAEQYDEDLKDLQPYFDEERITSFADHYYPQGFEVDVMFQDFLLDGTIEDLLTELDSEYERLSSH